MANKGASLWLSVMYGSPTHHPSCFQRIQQRFMSSTVHIRDPKEPQSEEFGIPSWKLAEIRKLLQEKPKDMSFVAVKVICLTSMVLMVVSFRTSPKSGGWVYDLLVGSFIGCFIGAVISRIVSWAYSASQKPKIPSVDLSRLEAFKAAHQEWSNARDERDHAYWLKMGGREFEERLASLLQNRGFEVSLTPASGDGGVDIIATNSSGVFLIQCKAHANPVGPEPMRALFGVLRSGYAGGNHAMMIALGGVTDGARRFAHQNGIVVWAVAEVVEFARGGPFA